MKTRLVSSLGVFALILAMAMTATAGMVRAQNSAGIGLSLTQTNVLGAFAEMDIAPGLTIQGNVGIDRSQHYDIVGFGIKGIYEVFPAISLVGGYAQWRNNKVVLAGLRYTDQIDRISVFGGVNYQYMVGSRKGNPGVEAGFKFLLHNRIYVGVEGGYRLMEDGTPGVSAYVGYLF